MPVLALNNRVPAVRHTAMVVRPFADTDLPLVARLHQRVFPRSVPVSDRTYQEYFTRVFLRNPAGPGPLPSLVCDGPDGELAGFLGVVPRRLVMRGRTYSAAIGSQFIVDPTGPAGLIALRLARTFREGPQDISIADEASDISKELWEALGGSTVWILSTHWIRPLRPAALGLSLLRARGGRRKLAALAWPFARLADHAAAARQNSPLRQITPAVHAEELHDATMLASVPDVCGPEALRVDHSIASLRWLLARAAHRGVGGRLFGSMIRRKHKIAGWYIGHVLSTGVVDIAQIAATPDATDDVLDHLFYRAWQEGALAVTGRLSPRFMQGLSDRHCVFHRRGPWMLVSTRHSELLHAFDTTQSCFSRLDGEWSLRL